MVFATITFLTGAAFVALSLWLRLLSTQAREWPTVKGQVIESRVDDIHQETMKPLLRYRYEVGCERYVGYRVAFSGYGVSKSAMQQLIKPYAQHSSVDVFYNPKNPSMAVLNNTAPSDWLYWLWFGVGFLLLATYLVWR